MNGIGRFPRNSTVAVARMKFVEKNPTIIDVFICLNDVASDYLEPWVMMYIELGKFDGNERSANQSLHHSNGATHGPSQTKKCA